MFHHEAVSKYVPGYSGILNSNHENFSKHVPGCYTLWVSDDEVFSKQIHGDANVSSSNERPLWNM